MQHINSAQSRAAAPEASSEKSWLLLPGCELDLSESSVLPSTLSIPQLSVPSDRAPPPISLFLGHLSSISFLLYLAPVSFMPPPPELMSSAPQASELGMLSVYYTYIFTSLVSKQTPCAFRGNIDFTPTRARQRSNTLLLSCKKKKCT